MSLIEAGGRVFVMCFLMKFCMSCSTLTAFTADSTGLIVNDTLQGKEEKRRRGKIRKEKD